MNTLSVFSPVSICALVKQILLTRKSEPTTVANRFNYWYKGKTMKIIEYIVLNDVKEMVNCINGIFFSHIARSADQGIVRL